MPGVTESIVINRPVEVVFAYLAEASNWTHWTSEVLEAGQTSPGVFGVGATLQGTDRILGMKANWAAKITEYDENKKFGQVIISGSRMVEQHLLFEPVTEGTRFSFSYSMGSTGMPSFLNPFLVKVFAGV